jgi:hypothetical protein
MRDKWPMTQEELDAWYEWILPWMELYGGLLKFGLQLFEPDGECIDPETGFSLGPECLMDLRTHFEYREAYGRAAYVHRFIQEYHTRWSEKNTMEMKVTNEKMTSA